MKRILICITLLTLVGCTRMDPNLALRVLQDAGHTNIVLGDAAPLICAGENSYSAEFTATGPTGRKVHGAVCQRLGSAGVTIRYR